jgi:hypothetical protein
MKWIRMGLAATLITLAASAAVFAQINAVVGGSYRTPASIPGGSERTQRRYGHRDHACH